MNNREKVHKKYGEKNVNQQRKEDIEGHEKEKH